MKKIFSKFTALLLVTLMLVASVPVYAVNSGAAAQELESITILTDERQTLAPGITQREVVFYDQFGEPQRMFVAVADPSNPDVSIETSFYNDQCVVSGLQKLTDQVAAAEANHAGENYKVVAGINAAFFNTSNGWPSGAFAMDGVIAQDAKNQPFFAILKDGTAMIGKTEQWDGVKDQVKEAIHCHSLIAWDGKNLANPNFATSNDQSDKDYPRTCIGITADGKVMAVQVDSNRPGVYSGMSLYEVADMMISMGCVAVGRLDEGGSSTYASRSEGSDEFTVKNNPVDGAERTISNGLIFVSTAAPSGIFDHAVISSDVDYFAPYTTYTFGAVGVDSTNGNAPIPAEAVWTLSDASFGTIENGTFVSSGKLGEFKVQLEYDGKVVGSKTIAVVNATNIGFGSVATMLPYGEKLELEVFAKYGNYDMFVDATSYTLTSSEANAGTINGNMFTAGNDKTVASTVLTVIYKYKTEILGTMNVTFGLASEILYDFENGDISSWLGNDEWDEIAESLGQLTSDKWADTHEASKSSTTFLATPENGQVKNGNYALGYTMTFTGNTANGSWGYTHLINLDILDNPTLWRDVANGVTGAKLGFWMYIPENATIVCPRIMWANSTDGQSWTRVHSKIMMRHGTTGEVVEIAYDGMKQDVIPEAGWNYVWADISAKDFAGYMTPTNVTTNTNGNNNNYPAFLEFIIHSTNKNCEEVTYFIDDITLDYSAAVPDRFSPIISNPATSITDGSSVALNGNKFNTNTFIFSANVADDTTSSGVINDTGVDYTTAQIYVDGQPIATTGANGKIMSDSIFLVDGVHDITFTVCDKAGNLNKLTKQITVNAGTQYPTVNVIGRNDSNATPVTGSVYYLDFTVSDISKIQSITTQVYLNGTNAFELDNMWVAKGFKAVASYNANTNIATITVTRTGEIGNDTSIAVLPIRVWNKNVSGNKPKIDIVYDVKMGKITYTSDVEADAGVVCGFGTAFTTVATDIQSGGNYHTHTSVAMPDSAATCLAHGYTGRTYCEGCQSVVAWGTSVEVLDHSYAFNAEDVLACVNGCEQTFTGIWTDGKEYADGVLIADGWVGDSYYVDGVKLTGIQLVDGYYYNFGENGVCNGQVKYNGLFYDETVSAWRYSKLGSLYGGWIYVVDSWHYFDTTTKVAVTGDYYYASRGITYHFDETGKTEGVWEKTAQGTRFWYGEWYYTARNANQRFFAEINGKTYNFDTNGFVTPGIHALYADWSQNMRGEMDVWEFDANGALVGQITTKGVVDNGRGGKYLIEEDGYVHGGNAGLREYNGDIYFVHHSGILQLNGTQNVTEATSHGLLAAGTYYFGADGKLFTGIMEGADGFLYYYKDGKLGNGIHNSALAEIGGSIYLVKWSGKIAANETRDIPEIKTNGLLATGTYYFGADGKLSTGIVEGADGLLYYYENGKLMNGRYNSELVEIDGAIYLIKWSGKVAANETRDILEIKTNGLLTAGVYYFGADGKLATGIVKGADGLLYYYENGKLMNGRYNSELVEIDGAIYLVKWSGKVAADETRDILEIKTNGLLKEGVYYFGADGKLFTGVKEGADGILYYYRNGKLGNSIYNSELVEIDGAIYLVKWSGKVAADETRTITSAKSNGLLKPGTYYFGADGKLA